MARLLVLLFSGKLLLIYLKEGVRFKRKKGNVKKTRSGYKKKNLLFYPNSKTNTNLSTKVAGCLSAKTRLMAELTVFLIFIKLFPLLYVRF